MTTHDKKSTFTLGELLTPQKLLWVLAWGLGLVMALSVLGLVGVSGWLITMAGVAMTVGVVYLVPCGLAVSRTLARYGDLVLSHQAVFGLLKELRVRFFTAWAKQPFTVKVHDADTSSQKMHRLVKDIDVLNEFPLRVVSPLIISSVAVVVMAMVVVAFLANGWGVAIGAVLCAVLGLPVLMWRWGVAVAQAEGQLTERHKSTLLDTLPVLTQLLTWGRWTDKVGALTLFDEESLLLTRQTQSARRKTQLIIQLVMAVAVVGLLFAVHERFADTVVMATDNVHVSRGFNPAWAVGLVLAVFGLIEIVMALVVEPLAYGRSKYAKDRLNALIAPIDPAHAVPLGWQHDWTLTLDNLSIKTPTGMTVMSGFSAEFTNTKPVLVVGASGAGKSTLLATLAGELERAGGEVWLNHQPMSQIDFGGSLGFLGQAVDIFDQTLADNLRLGKPTASEDELWTVLAQVGLADWAKSQPKGLDTPLGEYGMALSGGQARRVALARLLLTPKAVLLLDEPFAGLDDATRRHLWDELAEAQKAGHIGMLIIATHQLWAEMDAEVLVVGES